MHASIWGEIFKRIISLSPSMHYLVVVLSDLRLFDLRFSFYFGCELKVYGSWY